MASSSLKVRSFSTRFRGKDSFLYETFALM